MGSKREWPVTSRLGGVPTAVGAAASPAAAQLGLDLTSGLVEHPLPDVTHVHGWLDLAEQQRLAADFRAWAAPPAGLRHPRLPAGFVMTVQSVCLGWHWQPYAYSRTADDTDGAPVKPCPSTSSPWLVAPWPRRCPVPRRTTRTPPS